MKVTEEIVNEIRELPLEDKMVRLLDIIDHTRSKDIVGETKELLKDNFKTELTALGWACAKYDDEEYPGDANTIKLAINKFNEGNTDTQ